MHAEFSTNLILLNPVDVVERRTNACYKSLPHAKWQVRVLEMQATLVRVKGDHSLTRTNPANASWVSGSLISISIALTGLIDRRTTDE